MFGYISSILLFWSFAHFFVHFSVQYRMLMLVWNFQLFMVKLRLQWQTPSLLMLMVLWRLYIVHYHVSPLDLFRLKSCLLANCRVFKINLMCYILCAVYVILVEKKPENFEILWSFSKKSAYLLIWLNLAVADSTSEAAESWDEEVTYQSIF